MDRTERLLRLGYFPSQLPPSFITDDLAAQHALFLASWLALQDPPKKGVRVPKAPNSKAELFSVARVGHQRRITSLPNPIAQCPVAEPPWNRQDLRFSRNGWFGKFHRSPWHRRSGDSNNQTLACGRQYCRDPRLVIDTAMAENKTLPTCQRSRLQDPRDTN